MTNGHMRKIVNSVSKGGDRIRFYGALQHLFTFVMLVLWVFPASPVSAADVGNFTQLQNALATGGDYALTADIDADADFNAVGGSFTLDGNGHGINGDGSVQGISVSSGYTVDIKNIGQPDYSSSWNSTNHSLINQGTLSLSNIYWSSNNIAENTSIYGGIIRNLGTIGDVDNIHMDNNHVVSTSTTVWGGLIRNGQDGGAGIVWDKLTNSSFSNNTAFSTVAAPHGGVLLNLGATINLIDNVIFENNSMTSAENQVGGAHGVAIDNNGYGVIGTISNSIFRNNKTYRTGETEYPSNINYHASAGALDNYHRIGLIKNVLFENNSAESVASSATSGAIMSVGSSSAEGSGYIGGIEDSFFLNNHAYSKKKDALAGAISAGCGTETCSSSIDHIGNTVFQGNYAASEEGSAAGGALDTNSTINKIAGSVFKDNYAESKAGQSLGGAVANTGNIQIIDNVSFENNTVKTETQMAVGGAVLNMAASSPDNSGYIGSIVNSSFTDNSAYSKNNTAGGGALALGKSVSATGPAVIEHISNTVFSGNYTESETGGARAGALLGSGGTIGDMNNVTFNGNHVLAQQKQGQGGAAVISNIGEMNNISFIDNYVRVTNYNSVGGALVTVGTVGKLKNSLFSGNYVNVGSSYARGGGIFIGSGSFAGLENVNFVNNYATSRDSYALGGALYLNSGSMGQIVNSNFLGNYVSGNDESHGGAIYSKINLDIAARDGNSVFARNKVNDTLNSIYMGVDSLMLNLSADNGLLSIEDGISGTLYDINVSGTRSGEVALLGRVDNVRNFNLSNTMLHIGLNPISVQNYSADDSAILKIDVNPENETSGLLQVSGDVVGNSKVIINALSPRVLATDDTIRFLEAPNDDEATASSFEVFRVMGSPYLWSATQTGNTWYVAMSRESNPEYNGLVNAEVMAYLGLHSAAIEQTRSLFSSVHHNFISRKLAAHEENNADQTEFAKVRNVWVSPVYYTATNKKPGRVEGNVLGMEAGFDIQSDERNTIGVFASYRRGDYDLDGSGQWYHSHVGSSFDIKSYGGGLYYHFNRNNNRLFAVLYAGKQQADIKTDDGLKENGQALQLSGSIEAGHVFNFANGISLEPAVGFSHTQVDYENLADYAGKEAKFDNLKYSEIEAGVKLEKSLGTAGQLYIKPSIIKPFESGAKVLISGMDGKVATYDAELLWRGQIGGQFNVTDKLSAYGHVDYTFGEEYDAATLSVGVRYAW